MKQILLSAILLFISFEAFAQESIGGTAPSMQSFTQATPLKANQELQFIGYYINQAVTSDFAPTNDFLKGQTVGRMFGGNTTTTSNKLSAYIEQRLIPFFIYTPHLFDNKVTLRASFELDWTWGDVSYGAGGNFGGGFSADQVNLQTQNLEVEFNPFKGWYINLGLQRVFDTPYNPYRTLFDKMTTTGYRLAYFGTDGVGLTIRKDWDFSHVKAGYYKLYENYIQRDDDVTLYEIIGERDITKKWKVGASAYWIHDTASGAGGVSILGQGLNSMLDSHNGTFRFMKFGDVPYTADVVWLGMFFGRNTEHWLDSWMINGFVNANIGRARPVPVAGETYNSTWNTPIDIFGVAANGRISYRYGQTLYDTFTLDATFTTGDDNALDDNKYSGVITGNTWGAPGAIYISSGSYLLMPHGNVINRYTPLVMDISNMGYGLAMASLQAQHSFIPNRLIGKIGGAFAASPVQPLGGGNIIGAELNGSLVWNIGTYMSLELHAAHVWLGNFYDSAQDAYGAAVNGGIQGVRPKNPWTAFLVFKWLMF